MDLLDNNILIYAFRPDSPHHLVAREWLEDRLNSGHPLRLFPTVEMVFLRVVTHPAIFNPPSPMSEASGFLKVLHEVPSVEICPWTLATRERWLQLCHDPGLSGNDVNDALLAALVIERGLRMVIFDKGFRRFPGLRLLLLTSSSSPGGK